jgi:RHS repeat-associated protein
MNTRLTRYLALFLLAMPGAANANDKWYYRCNKGDCESCQSASCEPSVETYQTENGFDTEEEAREAGEKECKGEADNSYDGGSSAGGAQFTSPGVTAQNYSRSNLNFQDVSPDYAKTESINGVRTPKYLPVKQGGWHINDLPDGFEIAKYPSSGLGAPDNNGIRPVKSGAQASSVTTYRNPDGGKTTSQGNMDVVHKQRHPQTGEWVTRTIRIHAPQGNNNWTTKYYLGDPVQNPTLDPYRDIAITRTPNPDGSETTREVINDRDTSGNYVITSDLTRTYAFYKHGEPAILSETKHTGTGSEPTTSWTYFHNSADQGSFNKPATMRRSDGQWSNTTYQGNPVTGTLVTKTVSGWLDNAAPAIGTAPDENANRVVTEFEAKNETGTIGREEKIQGVTVSKTWGERYKANSGEVIEKSRVETGSATLTTIRTGYPDNDSVSAVERGRLKSIQHPDGTVTLHRHTMQGDNRLETIDTGVGTLSGVTDGTRTVSTYTKDDVLMAQVTSDIASGIELSARQAIAFDSNDQPTRWAHDNNPDDYSEILNGCCGIDSERTRDGILTTYTRDGLKRPKTATSRGITLSYTYGRKTIGGTDFPSISIAATAGNLTLNKGTTVHDHAGNIIQQISPDLDGDGNEEITSTIRDFTARTITTTNPDGGTIISTNHADGQSKSTTGTATTTKFYQYATHAEQGGGLASATASTANGPWTKTYENLAGRTLKTTFDDGTSEIALQTNGFDNLGRLISAKDADNVTQLIAYNSEGEAYRRAIDLNQNGQIDSTDRVTDTLTDILNVQGFGPTIRQQTIVYDEANTARTANTTLRSPDGLLTRTTTLGVANPSTSTSAPHADRTDGAWTDTSTAPDGTKSSVTYQNWLAVTNSRLDTANNVIESTTTGHDALRRPITQTHSRTASAVITRTAYHANNGLVVSLTEDVTTGTDRVNSFGYDSMGRRTSTTLPDNSITHTSYWPTGNVKATWGSQINPNVKLYTAEGRLQKLRTFRSTNLALAPDESTGSYDETTWFYTDRGQLERKQYADGKGTDYTYTSGGRLHTRTWARGIVTTYGYNSAGDLTTTDYSDDTPDVTLVPDRLGRQHSASNGIAQSVFTYDSNSLALDYETIFYNLDGQPGFEFSRVLDRSRDPLGRDRGFTLMTSGEQPTTENQAIYAYSPSSGRLSSVSNPQLSNVPFAYEYVPNSNLIDAVTGPVHTVDNVWEPDRDVLDIKENKVGSATVSKYDYEVNSLGQRITAGQTGSAFAAARGITWGYDALGQVTSADSTENVHDRGYLYDAIGNRRGIRNEAVGVPTNPDGSITADQGTVQYASNALNQYTTVNGSALPQDAYDFDGNLKSGRLPANQTENSGLTWDAENRLVEVRVGTNGPLVRYAYDSLSRRIARSVGTSTTIYLYAGWNVIAEYEGTGLAKTYIWGADLSGTMQGAGGVGGLLAVKSGGAVQFPTFDGNGNVSEYLDGNGAPAAHFEYDSFGNTVVNTDTPGLFPYRFSTKPIDAATGLYYYGYRYYDPETGRWPSRDPIGEVGGTNLYGFVWNQAFNAVDYLGMRLTNRAMKFVSAESADGRALINKGKRDDPMGWSGETTRPLTDDGKNDTSTRKDPDDEKKCCVRLSESIEYNVVVESTVINDLIGISQTKSGFSAIVAHEDRRRDVVVRAYGEYLEVFEGEILNHCPEKCGLTKGQASAHANRLIKWLKGVQSDSKSQYSKWVNEQQDAISGENSRLEYITPPTSDEFPFGVQLINGIRNPHQVPNPPPIKFEECPK